MADARRARDKRRDTRSKPRAQPSLYDVAPRKGVSMRPFERSLPMALLKAREAVMRGFRRLLREHGLNEQEWRIIRALVEVDRLEIGELADMVFILKPSATRTIRNLQARGLVSRTRSSSDQRRAFIALTAQGRELFATVAPRSEVEYARLTGLIGGDSLQQLYALLNQLTVALDEAERE
jgi:homoprotocatechuate degradation regulator HpaR